MTLTYRDLTTLEEFAQVVELERQIWGPGYVDVVPVSILAVSVHRGGILIGAFDGDRMIGFVYSLPAIKGGKTAQWSHMAGVVDGYRSAGLGRTLKLLQRERTIAMGLDLIEWTYDPLQAMNAHLNFAKLGVVVEEYAENIYGTSASPLHQGNPTDRFVAEWWILEPHVERRLAGGGLLTLKTNRWTWTCRSTRAGCWSKSRWGSPRCCRPRPSWRSPGASARERSSPPTSIAVIRPLTSSSIGRHAGAPTCSRASD
jgi:predicted GNAT superfamily acetyltransferase